MIAIRPATAADQKTITAIIRAVQINPMDLKWPNFVLAVDEDNGTIVGTAQIKQHGDGSHELASIATLPSYRGRGIASQLIHHLLAENSGTLYLTCIDTMGTFYEPFGFRTITEKEMTPYFRRLLRVAATFRFLSDDGHHLLVMQRG
jgi:N-acetylglutamate synthase-like GNAT family acetyltransferase